MYPHPLTLERLPPGNSVTDISTKDAISISVVAGLMVGTMAVFISIFATGLEDPDILFSLRIGLITGSTASILILTFAIYRINEISSKGDLREEKRREETDFLRAVLSPIEERASSDGNSWNVRQRIRRERGVLVVDLLGLDPPSAAAIGERLIDSRGGLRRVKIRTGIIGKEYDSNYQPGVRNAIMQRLKIDAERVNWQVIQKSSSITLRPMGESPSLRLWVTRFGIFSIPVTLVMALAFRDLAGEGLEYQGLLFGASSGLVIAALAATYRDRSS
tara:strand:- start:1554 stop:2381 length:828 start_codon:yes stop_codon:yes gene_type:complete